MDSYTRQHMILLIEDLCVLKDYKTETIYLAISLADRFLINLSIKNEQAPCLISLAVICSLMAAKLEQPISPCFGNIIYVLEM